MQPQQNELTSSAPSPPVNGSGTPTSHSTLRDKLIGLEIVKELSGCGRSKIYAMMQNGQFPKQVSVGGKSLWSEREIDAWVEQNKGKRA